MRINGTIIEDTHAEAFSAWAAIITVTAVDDYWLQAALREVTGYGTSVIACDAEVGVMGYLDPSTTPDNRVGASVMLFARHLEQLADATVNRSGQALLTCPTVSVFSGIRSPATDLIQPIALGENIHQFGDGFEKQVTISDRPCWSIPVMDGECIIEATTCAMKGVAGGNILICGQNQRKTLDAARRAAEAISRCPNVIAPFPAGVVRSGSKVGSRNGRLIASTNDEYCPGLRGLTHSRVVEDVNCVYEIVIDGLTLQAVTDAMCAAINAASGPDIYNITAANFQGRLGTINIKLHEVLASGNKP